MTGLYLHIPFCAHACPYCDFSFELLRKPLVERFVRALSAEIDRYTAIPPWKHVRFTSLFLGGGTPTSLSVHVLRDILLRLRAAFDIAEEAEITVEANPETVTDEKLAMLREMGVNRLSLGVQAFTPASLRRLGRHHSVERAVRAVDQARRAGIPHLNLDLMFGAPGQTMADWDETLAAGLALAPDHLSAYGLTIEEGTPFGHLAGAGRLDLPDEETHIALYHRAVDRLTQGGYRHYEVSNFALPGAECRHNLVYWTGGDYLGLGPSAHSHHRGRRFANVRRLADYLERMEQGACATGYEETLTHDERMHEAILLGLRLTAGLDIPAFRRHFGREAYQRREEIIDTLASSGFLERAGHRLRLTRKGLAVADTVCAALM
jgi:oxygen-independent coproporphyrinogen-3 oxidase